MIFRPFMRWALSECLQHLLCFFCKLVTKSLNMKTRILLFLLAIPFFTTSSDAQWKPTGPAGGNLGSIVTIDTMAFLGTSGFGVYISTDNGASWRASNAGLTDKHITAIGVSEDASGDTTLAINTYSGNFVSTDKGASWDTANSGLPPFTQLRYYLATGSNEQSSKLFASTGVADVYLSTDNGKSWTAQNAAFSDKASIFNLAATSIDTKNPTLIAGTDSGVFISSDNGVTWNPSDSGFPVDTGSTAWDVVSLATVGAGSSAGMIFAGIDSAGVFSFYE